MAREKLLSASELARQSGVSSATVFRYKYRGELWPYQHGIGRTAMFTRKAISAVKRLRKAGLAMRGRPRKEG